MNEKNQILIEAVPHFIREKSSPAENRYVFAYTITISNRGEKGAKLLSRQWLIIDSNAKTQEISGDGVAGKQPYLKPGDVFRYTSGAMIETSVGVMQGQYFFVEDDGRQFTAAIPKFTLSIPRTLH